MGLVDKILDAAELLFEVVHLVREGNATDRKVQCEGTRDETETGREIFRDVRNWGPAGFKHRTAPKTGGVAKEKGLILQLGDITVLLGAHLEAGEPTDLDEGDTAIYSSSGAQVRCKGTTVEIGSGAGGLIIRKDYFETWWEATPRANFLTHTHPYNPGPGAAVQTGPPVGDLGAVGNIENDEGHTSK